MGGSTDNSELGLAFVYNGFGRVGGEFGGPGPIPQRFVAPSAAATGAGARPVAHVSLPRPAPDVEPARAAATTRSPLAYGKSPGPLRLFKKGMDDQGAWLLPFALIALIALALARPRRRDPRLAVLLVFGGFMFVEAFVLSFSRGIVHPYYISALAPGVAAMCGAGVAALAGLRGRARLILPAAAIAITVAVQVHLLHHAHYLRAWIPVLIVLEALALVLLLVRRRGATATLACALAVLLVAPTAYSTTTWSEPVNNTFPAAGPRAAEGNGGTGVDANELGANRALIDYVIAHEPGTRFQLLTQASLTAAVPILLGVKAAAMGGYGGVDPALDGPGLGRLVARGEARYVLIGGAYAYLGGNKASQAAERVCREVPAALWQGAYSAVDKGLYLLDCRGLAAQLERQPA